MRRVDQDDVAHPSSELAVSGRGASFWRTNETLLAHIVIKRQQAEKLFGLLAVPPP